MFTWVFTTKQRNVHLTDVIQNFIILELLGETNDHCLVYNILSHVNNCVYFTHINTRIFRVSTSVLTDTKISDFKILTAYVLSHMMIQGSIKFFCSLVLKVAS